MGLLGLSSIWNGEAGYTEDLGLFWVGQELFGEACSYTKHLRWADEQRCGSRQGI